MRIYYTAANNGDGSAGIEFFESQECIDLLEEADPETYGMGESGSFDVEGTITGISVQTLVETKEQIEDFC